MNKALSGLNAWIVQRLTAVYMLLFLVLVLVRFTCDTPDSYAEWRAWVVNPYFLIPLAIFFIFLLMHMWVGLRDVMMDYVKPMPLRMFCLAMLFIVLMGAAFRIVKILLSVSI